MIDAGTREKLEKTLGDRIEFDVPLARHTSLRIGGPADAMVTPESREELAATLQLCREDDLPTIVLGAGFNVLVRDGGLAAVVLRLKKLRRIERTSEQELQIECGASHATITRYCVEHGLKGLEFGAGIPGTLGGWLAMNAGIGVREIKDAVLAVEWIDACGLRFENAHRDALDFQYRTLANRPTGAVLTRATLAVETSDRETVQAEIDRLLAHRQKTQPTDIPSCGSVFRNPPGDFAGRLVEAAGLKGLRVGGAEISDLHANFIVNRGGATAHDVLSLITHAQEQVAQHSGVSLEPEVQVLGREPAEENS